MDHRDNLVDVQARDNVRSCKQVTYTGDITVEYKDSRDWPWIPVSTAHRKVEFSFPSAGIFSEHNAARLRACRSVSVNPDCLHCNRHWR
jgi:hypothetical protein